MIEEFPKTPLNRVRRVRKRAHYDAETIYSIIDAAQICQVGFVVDEQPFVIPTLHARDEDRILLHGAVAGRLMRYLAGGGKVCLSWTLVDGLVLARSVFNHSVNYRSAMVFGSGYSIEGDEERLAALERFTEKLIPGRWADSRPPNRVELLQTSIVAIEIESASAKVRTGAPGDEEADYALPHWAGVVPFETRIGAFQPDPRLAAETDVPEYLTQLQRNFNKE
jgi:nitroimidazol reductase NimA-like FMN-containing flavoprotein (pyridoxamine 5'-phosphate oxidase superfamily)